MTTPLPIDYPEMLVDHMRPAHRIPRLKRLAPKADPLTVLMIFMLIVLALLVAQLRDDKVTLQERVAHLESWKAVRLVQDNENCEQFSAGSGGPAAEFCIRTVAQQ